MYIYKAADRQTDRQWCSSLDGQSSYCVNTPRPFDNAGKYNTPNLARLEITRISIQLMYFRYTHSSSSILHPATLLASRLYSNALSLDLVLFIFTCLTFLTISLIFSSARSLAFFLFRFLQFVRRRITFVIVPGGFRLKIESTSKAKEQTRPGITNNSSATSVGNTLNTTRLIPVSNTSHVKILTCP